MLRHAFKVTENDALMRMFRLIFTQVFMPKKCANNLMKSLLFKSC